MQKSTKKSVLNDLTRFWLTQKINTKGSFMYEDIKFDKSQNTAITHFRGPFLCLAGPGSGKTTVFATMTNSYF